jgi:hypothetical protein
VRGTKLEAWRIPSVWKSLQENVLTVPEGSNVPQRQKKMLAATSEVLTAVAKDVREGLLETVGVDSELSMDEGRCSMVLDLPEDADAEEIARAIDLENVEAWRDGRGKVRIALSPWYLTKDVDQTVLSAVKVIHVMLGIHASDADALKPKTLKQKLLSSVMEVMQIQKGAAKNKD